MASIKDLGNGKYRVFVCNGFKSNGAVNRKSQVITAKSLKDAEKQAQAIEVHFKEGNLEKGKDQAVTVFTVNDLANQWKELVAENLVVKTRERYEEILNDFILPAFGSYKISDIRAIDIDRYLNSLKQNGIRRDGKPGGYSQKTILHHYVLLHKLFHEAVRWDMATENVCDKVDRPKVDKKEAHYYEEDQIGEMLKCLENESDVYKAYVLIALASGCRRSEVLGLEWDDLDFQSNCITIRRTSHYSVDQGVYTQDKTKNGDPSRTITMPIQVMDFLKQYRESQETKRKSMGNEWVASNRLFVAETGGSITPAGSPILPDNISQWFERFLEKNHLSKITLHQLRHTSISYLINNGVDIETVSQRAGHKNISTTAMIYGHVFQKSKRESADKFSELLNKENEK